MMNCSLLRLHPFQCCTLALTRPHSFTHSVCPLPHSFTLSIARHFWGQNYMICICIRRLGREVEWGALRGSHRNPSCADDICKSGDGELRREAILAEYGHLLKQISCHLQCPYLCPHRQSVSGPTHLQSMPSGFTQETNRRFLSLFGITSLLYFCQIENKSRKSLLKQTGSLTRTT